MSHALEQINAARKGVICKSASTAPHFLLARVQLSICFPISRSRIHPTASPYLCLADCFQEMMFEQARTSHSTWDFFGHIKSGRTQFFDRKVGSDISAPCTRESKNKFGSKCDAFGADMSSRMSAPGISCSKETVLCIGFMMDHHRDY